MSVKTTFKCQILHIHHSAQWGSNIELEEHKEKLIFSAVEVLKQNQTEILKENIQIGQNCTWEQHLNK